MKRAPIYLKKETRKWMNGILKNYGLESHHVKLLLHAAEAWDRSTEARLVVAEHGLLIPGKDKTLKQNPAVPIERDAKILFARLLRELQLDVAEPEKKRIPRF